MYYIGCRMVCDEGLCLHAINTPLMVCIATASPPFKRLSLKFVSPLLPHVIAQTEFSPDIWSWAELCTYICIIYIHNSAQDHISGENSVWAITCGSKGETNLSDSRLKGGEAVAMQTIKECWWHEGTNLHQMAKTWLQVLALVCTRMVYSTIAYNG